LPFEADTLSLLGMQYMMDLLYGPCPLKIGFASQAAENHLRLPSIFMAIANQTNYRESTSVSLVARTQHRVLDLLWQYYIMFPHLFAVPVCDSPSALEIEVFDHIVRRL
jgi:hypothetical protein